MKPLIIAIAGPSGAGKTVLSEEIRRRLEVPCSRLPLDSYYQPQPHLDMEQRALRNYDHPDALDWAMMETHLDSLAAGRGIEIPVYLFDRHTRAGHTHPVQPAGVVIVEGILALHHAGVRKRADLKAFVETSEPACLRRRIERDVAERGRTLESVLQQYNATVRPMMDEFVLPSRIYADVIVSGEEPLEQAASEMLRRIMALSRL